MSKVTTPSPEAFLYVNGEHRGVSLNLCGGMDLSDGTVRHGLITTTQAEAYADARVQKALEEAAQACEARIGQHAPGMTPEDVEDCDEEARLCAAAVRALIPPLSGPVEP